MQQGYTGERDIVVLTPYVGQLLRLKKAVAASNMRVILDERDTAELAVLEDAEEAATAASADTTAGQQAGAAAEPLRSGQAAGVSAASSSSSSVVEGLSGSSVRVVDMESCLRLATIDNFQVS
jgi:hypothetical protein